MQTAMKTFAVDEQSVSGYIYHKLMGHEVPVPPRYAYSDAQEVSGEMTVYRRDLILRAGCQLPTCPI